MTDVLDSLAAWTTSLAGAGSQLAATNDQLSQVKLELWLLLLLLAAIAVLVFWHFYL